MKHFVNFSLLLFFTTLVVSGVLRFALPFTMATTRVHIVFGLGVLVFVLLHLVTRLRYFTRMLLYKPAPMQPRAHLSWRVRGAIVGLWGAALIVALWDLPPVPLLIGQSYEARHRAAIFRAGPGTAAREMKDGLEVLHKADNAISETAETDVAKHGKGGATLQVEILWGPAFEPGSSLNGPLGGARPQLAVWAESNTGSMIQTLFVSEHSAFAENMTWGGHPQRRVDILPLWRHSYTLLNGVEPDGQIDAYSTATPEHSFSVTRYLQADASAFTVNVEVNVPNDTNAFYHDQQSPDNPGYALPGLGQPSVLYSALIHPDAEKTYYLLDFVGHGGSGPETNGSLYYNTDHLTTAKSIIERVLVKVIVDPRPDNRDSEQAP